MYLLLILQNTRILSKFQEDLILSSSLHLFHKHILSSCQLGGRRERLFSVNKVLPSLWMQGPPVIIYTHGWPVHWITDKLNLVTAHHEICLKPLRMPGLHNNLKVITMINMVCGKVLLLNDNLYYGWLLDRPSIQMNRHGWTNQCS